MYNTRNPTDPSINDTVALQDDWKPDSDDDLHAAMDIRRNPAHTSTDNRIEFFSLGGSSPPTTSMALEWDTPPRNRGLTRTFCR